MTPSHVRRRSLASVCGAVLFLGLLGTAPASAHDGKGILVVESTGPTEGLAIPFVVRLTWAGDGHAAVDATVTATALGTDATTTTPVPMQPVGQDGRYEATVEVPEPGPWTIRFTSVTPAATLEVEETVTPPSTTSTTAQPTTTIVAPTRTAAEAGPDDEGNGVGGMLAALFLAIVVIACAVGFYRSSRRLRGER